MNREEETFWTIGNYRFAKRAAFTTAGSILVEFTEGMLKPPCTCKPAIRSGAGDDKVTSIQVLGCYHSPNSFGAGKNLSAGISCSHAVFDTTGKYDFSRCDGRYRDDQRSLCCSFPEGVAW